MSDITDLTIVIILMVILICYTSYLRVLIEATFNINNVKCNPLNLFIKSINADSPDSIDDFAECVHLLGPNN
jgi:hypothetical protein